MSLRSLPACVQTVVVPDCFSVTAIVSFSECRLRAIFASAKSTSYRLPSGPEAAIGTLVHRVKETWASRTEGSLTPEDVFDAEYAAMVKELESDVDRRHFADLSATRAPGEWSMIRRQAVTHCAVLAPMAESRKGTRASAHGPRVGSEV